MLPIKEAPKSESEDTPPSTPKEATPEPEPVPVKSDGFKESSDEDFIPDNIYDDADLKASQMKDYVS